jgi:uncharacterized membrane protein
MVKSIGAALGLFAFAVTAVMGLVAGNPAEVILLRALWAMVIFCLIGMVTGWVASRVLDEHILRKEQEMLADEGDKTPGSPQVANDTLLSGADTAGQA